MCRIGPCNTEVPEKLPLDRTVNPEPEEGKKIKIGYTGDYDEEEGGEEE